MKKETAATSTVDSAALAKLEAETKQANALTTIKITSAATYDAAIDGLQVAKQLIKKIKEHFKPMLDSAKATLDTIKAEQEKHLAPVQEIDLQLRGETSRWAAKLLAEEAKRKAAAEVKLEAKKAEAIKAGKDPDEVKAPTVKAADLGGQSFRDVWEVTAIDPALVPAEYWILDEVKINAEVRLNKGQTNIPGVTVACRKVAVVR
jgi:hypothetical protein